MQNVQRDFVLGVLSEEELGQQIHIHELSREYAACVQTLRAYDAVSRDILQVRAAHAIFSTGAMLPLYDTPCLTETKGTL